MPIATSRRTALLLLPAVIMAGVVAARSGAAEPKTAQLMRQKLEHSQKILAALAVEDFETVEKSASQLDLLTLEQWVDNDSADYRTQLKFFRFANEELIRLAREKNVDGAALAYTQLTLSCVNCHKQLRAAED